MTRLSADLRAARTEVSRASHALALASEVGLVREGVRSVKAALAGADPSAALRGLQSGSGGGRDHF